MAARALLRAPCRALLANNACTSMSSAVSSGARAVFGGARPFPMAPQGPASGFSLRSFSQRDAVAGVLMQNSLQLGSLVRGAPCLQQIRGFAIRRGRGPMPHQDQDSSMAGRDDILGTWQQIQEEQLHQEALTVNVQNNDVDGALKRLKRKAIEDGVMKKWRDQQYHTKRAQARRFTKQLNVRRAQRRTMRANLRLVYDSMAAEKEDRLLAQRIGSGEPDEDFPSYLPFDENLDYPTEPTWPLPS